MSLPVAEQWRPVVGYEGHYEVSDQGRVKSLARTVENCLGRTRRLRERDLKPSIGPGHGRRVVGLYLDGTQRTYTIYPLVLTAFVGPRPPGMEACHNDGDCLNDALANLRWDTSSGNSYDLVRHGRHNNAIKTHCPRSHRLNEPNLVPSALADGRRDCFACHKARARLQRNKRNPIEPDLKAIADEYYARIMKE